MFLCGCLVHVALRPKFYRSAAFTHGFQGHMMKTPVVIGLNREFNKNDIFLTSALDKLQAFRFLETP